MEQLFLNMHNLINAFRPHQVLTCLSTRPRTSLLSLRASATGDLTACVSPQARETIIQMLKAQIQERRDAAQDIRKYGSSSRMGEWVND